MRNTFKVYERLKREQHIDTLFRTGKAFSVFPIRLVYHLVPRVAGELSPVLAGFSVPKKKFRSSVDRHRVRRLMVENWRLNKQNLYPAVPEGQQLHLFFIFTDSKLPEFELARQALVKGIMKLAEILRQTNAQCPMPNPRT